MLKYITKNIFLGCFKKRSNAILKKISFSDLPFRLIIDKILIHIKHTIDWRYEFITDYNGKIIYTYVIRSLYGTFIKDITKTRFQLFKILDIHMKRTHKINIPSKTINCFIIFYSRNCLKTIFPNPKRNIKLGKLPLSCTHISTNCYTMVKFSKFVRTLNIHKCFCDINLSKNIVHLGIYDCHGTINIKNGVKLLEIRNHKNTIRIPNSIEILSLHNYSKYVDLGKHLQFVWIENCNKIFEIPEGPIYIEIENTNISKIPDSTLYLHSYNNIKLENYPKNIKILYVVGQFNFPKKNIEIPIIKTNPNLIYAILCNKHFYGDPKSSKGNTQINILLRKIFENIINDVKRKYNLF